MLANLIDNALKYNHPGGNIQVYAAAAHRALAPSNEDSHAPKSARTHSQPCAVIQVRDTGRGIPASSQARLFERFFRVDSARVAGGSGLGLSIAQEIVRAHRGGITFESQEGVGTTFSVWLPAKGN